MSIRNGDGAPPGRNPSDGAHQEKTLLAGCRGQRWRPPELPANGGRGAPPTSFACTERVVSDALAVVLAATRLVIVWHAGTVDAEEAMHALQQAVHDRLRTADLHVAPKAPNRSAARGRRATSGVAPGLLPSS